MKSQVEATVTIVSARLALQSGFAHVDNSDGRPSPIWLLPLTFSPTAEGALVFVIRSDLAVERQRMFKLLHKLSSSVSSIW